MSTWSSVLNFIKNLLLVIFTFGKKGSLSNKTEDTMQDSVNEKEPEATASVAPKWSKEQLLTPLRHKRYISLYCVADLSDGDYPIYTPGGSEIWKISARSLKRLNMEGTGRLSNGKVVNVVDVGEGNWTYSVMGESSPDGVGIRGKALKPWFSLAHSLRQLKEHDLFERTVIIPSLVGYRTNYGNIHDGKFEVHDTGGGLRRCPFENGLWRTGPSRDEYGQFDLFMGGPEDDYDNLLKSWDSYKEVIVMPRDTESPEGIQETLNLLMDAGLDIDGAIGPKSRAAIKNLQSKAGLEETGEWDNLTKEFADLSLTNW